MSRIIIISILLALMPIISDEVAVSRTLNIEGDTSVIGLSNSQVGPGFWPSFASCTSCGDANNDGIVDISDIVFLVSYLSGHGVPPGPCGGNPIGLGNADGCGIVTISDVYTIWRKVFCVGPDPSGCENMAPCSTIVRDTVKVGTPPYSIYPGGDSVAIPIYITANSLGAYSLGFACSSDSIMLSSVDWSGSEVSLAKGSRGVLQRGSQILIFDFLSCHSQNQYRDALLCKLNARIVQGDSTQPILLDSAFVPPGGEWLFVGVDGQHYRPNFVPNHYEPGDANGDGGIDVFDAVYLINYIFSGGPAPTPYEICSGDANCDCGVDISDAVYLICYIFLGCPAPCSCEEWVVKCGLPLRK
jgi:hypothetical protein